MSHYPIFKVTVAGGRRIARTAHLHRERRMIRELLDKGYTVFFAVDGTPHSVAVQIKKGGVVDASANNAEAERYVRPVLDGLRLGG